MVVIIQFFQLCYSKVDCVILILLAFASEKVTRKRINLLLVTHHHMIQIHRSEFTRLDLWNATKCIFFSQELAFQVCHICVRLKVNLIKSLV